ncbi:hypothetical protein ACOI1H_22750 [Loktanella sp. DJP18]|uniref:hypothetical protein n=1 Tax=Loktanella sp. DJP18 TaxID=3409788 RepID=UPI003BB560AE
MLIALFLAGDRIEHPKMTGQRDIYLVKVEQLLGSNHGRLALRGITGSLENFLANPRAAGMAISKI